MRDESIVQIFRSAAEIFSERQIQNGGQRRLTSTSGSGLYHEAVFGTHSESTQQISSKSGNTWLRYCNLSIVKMAVICHLVRVGLAVTIRRPPEFNFLLTCQICFRYFYLWPRYSLKTKFKMAAVEGSFRLPVLVLIITSSAGPIMCLHPKFHQNLAICG